MLLNFSTKRLFHGGIGTNYRYSDHIYFLLYNLLNTITIRFKIF